MTVYHIDFVVDKFITNDKYAVKCCISVLESILLLINYISHLCNTEIGPLLSYN